MLAACRLVIQELDACRLLLLGPDQANADSQPSPVLC